MYKPIYDSTSGGKRVAEIITWVFLLFLIPSTALGYFSETSIPGQPLFPVKLGIERVVLAMQSFSPQAQASYQVDLVNKRFDEIQTLLTKDTTNAEDLDNLGIQLDTATKYIAALPDSPEKTKIQQRLVTNVQTYQEQLKIQQQVIQNRQQIILEQTNQYNSDIRFSGPNPTQTPSPTPEENRTSNFSVTLTSTPIPPTPTPNTMSEEEQAALQQALDDLQNQMDDITNDNQQDTNPNDNGSPTPTPTLTFTPTSTPTMQPTPSFTPIPTLRPTNTPTPRPRPTNTPTPRPRPTNTPTPYTPHWQCSNFGFCISNNDAYDRCLLHIKPEYNYPNSCSQQKPVCCTQWDYGQ